MGKMSIHIFVGYATTILRQLDQYDLDQIKIGINCSYEGHKQFVTGATIELNENKLPADFNPVQFISVYSLQLFNMERLNNKILINFHEKLPIFSFEHQVIQNFHLNLINIQTPIFVNEIQVNTDIKNIEWTHEDKQAYYLLSTVFNQISNVQQDKTYHHFNQLSFPLNKLVVCNGYNRPDILNMNQYGVSGIVVAKEPLAVKAGLEINKLQCPVWQKINSKLSTITLKKINSWFKCSRYPHKNLINRALLFNEYSPLQLTTTHIKAIVEAPLFVDAVGTRLNLLKLFSSKQVHFYFNESSWAERDHGVNNHLIDSTTFFGQIKSKGKHNYVARLLASEKHSATIFIELIDKYINTVSGNFKYRKELPMEMNKHLQSIRQAFLEATRYTKKITWVFHLSDGAIKYELSTNGFRKQSVVQTSAKAA